MGTFLMILLTILKVIGIILLVVLLLFLLLLNIILWVPIRYNIELENDSSFWLHGRITWLMRLFRINVDIVDGKTSYSFKFIKTWFSSEDDRQETEKVEETQSNNSEVEKVVQENSKEINTIENKARANTKASKKKEKIDNKRKKPNSKNKPDTKANKPQKKEQKNNEEVSFLNKIKGIYQEYDRYPQKGETIEVLFNYIKKVLKHVLPKNYILKGTIGFEDPATTGYVVGLCNVLLPFLIFNQEVYVESDFDQEVLKVYFKAKGRIIVGVLIFYTLKCLINKRTRYCIKYFKQRK